MLDALSKQYFSSSFDDNSLDTKEGRKNFQTNAAEFSNYTRMEVVSTVLEAPTIKDASKIYSFWIDVAKEALEIRNLEVSFAIFTALETTNLFNLFGEGKPANCILEDRTKEDRGYLSRIFQFEKNYGAIRNYQQELSSKSCDFFGPHIVLAKDVEHLSATTHSEAKEKTKNMFASFLKQSRSTIKTKINPIHFDDNESRFDHQSNRFKQLIKLTQSAMTFKTKQEEFDHDQTLQKLCFIASIRTRNNEWHLKNTSSVGRNFLQILNLPEYELLRREISPDGEEIRMRDVRNYGRFGVKSTSGYFLNAQDKDNEIFFSRVNNKNKEQPGLIFHEHQQKYSNRQQSNSVSNDRNTSL